MARQELLFRFILRVVRRLDAVYHDVALVYAQLFHGAVVHGAAAAQSENDGGKNERSNFHGHLFCYPNDKDCIRSGSKRNSEHNLYQKWQRTTCKSPWVNAKELTRLIPFEVPGA
jgi:hypothetical protein